ncbi:MAG: sugar transferase [Clostridia bacterium]|jgi:lipopolysaccharide/colanic/teichoic acid biosynthesis glycosyltransferase|nr:sugar transferase [Clostridia bacterium]
MRTDAVRPYYDVLAKHRGSLVVKRAFDIVAGCVTFVVLAIPMGVIAVMIKADSEGPVFYRQERVTAYGGKFRIHKFRTMVNNADRLGSAVTVSGDSRITRVGARLRDHRLDEFPQVLDVLTGDMSFVGTRPEAVKYVERYTPEMMATLLLPAGITSEASVEFKDEAELLESAENADETYLRDILPRKMDINLRTVREFSLGREFRTLLGTVFEVFLRK